MEVKKFPYTLEKFNMNAPEIKFVDGSLKIEEKIVAQCVEMADEAIVKAVIDCAKENGITQLYLLDKDFVVTALQDAIKKYGY